MRPRFGGTGLGLTLVKAFVEKHGGVFDIASEPNVGTTIAVRCPMPRREDGTGEATKLVAAPRLARVDRRAAEP